MNKFYRYSVDIINNERISGWCYHRFRKTKPVTLTIFADKEKLGEISADQMRVDLLAHNLHSSGYCGFTFNLPGKYTIRDHGSISLRVNGGRRSLVSFITDQVPSIIEEPVPNVLFMHIPKTAGTSFHTFVRTYFPQGSTISHIQAESRNNYRNYSETYNYIAGHLPIRTLKEYFDLSRFDLFTLVREPYSHLHSHLNWVQSIIENPDSGFCQGHSIIFRELAEKLKGMVLSRPEVLHSFVQGVKGIELDLFDNPQTRYFLDFRPDKVTHLELNNAEMNLQHFTNIGVTEQYNQFVLNFCRQYHAKYYMQANILNRGKSGLLFDYNDAVIKAVLYPLVEFDLCLYDHVCKTYKPKLKT